MKILTINKFYFHFAGGEGTMFVIKKLMEERGHQIIPFAMNHPRTVENEFRPYFLPYFDYNKPDTPFLEKARAAAKILYNREAKSNLEALIRRTAPDIAHVHNIYHQISPSVLDALRKHDIPIIMTLHDYKLLCPNNKFFRRGKVCEACRGGRFYRAFLHKCVKDSWVASSICSVEMYLHHHLKLYERKVAHYISHSAFFKDKMVEYGYDPDKITVLPIIPGRIARKPRYRNKGYILFFGRLSEEKGLDILLRAMKRLPEVELRIAGQGASEPALRDYVEKNRMENVKFLGFLSGAAMDEALRDAAFTVISSIWYENFPLSALESFSFGKPVVGARIGGIPEIIDDGVDGYLYDPLDPDDLVRKIRTMIESLHRIERMGRKARKKIEEQYDGTQYSEKLMALYERTRDSRVG